MVSLNRNQILPEKEKNSFLLMRKFDLSSGCQKERNNLSLHNCETYIREDFVQISVARLA